MTAPHRRRKQRFHLPLVSRLCPNFTISAILRYCSSSALYLLGPVLIIVTLGILSNLAWTFYYILIPLKFHSYDSFESIAHQIFVAFILFNITFNYISCVLTKHTNTKYYQSVVRELARATGFDYPETTEEAEEWRKQWREMIIERVRQKRLRDKYEMMSKYGYDEENNHGLQTSHEVEGDTLKRRTGHSSTGNSAALHNHEKRTLPMMEGQRVSSGPSWLRMGANDWSWCNRSQLPKPPRSHFDHVTKSLVLNMDHYCPWMFNVVGYFNYRYFITFLIYVSIGMSYGAILCYQPFMLIDGPIYREQIARSREMYKMENQDSKTDFRHSHIFKYTHVKHLIEGCPIPNEVTPIAFAFMLCVAVGLSVIILLSFHLYLIKTAQTTIEFHGNRLKKEDCKDMGQVWVNQNDLGVKRNFEQVFCRWPRDSSWAFFWIALLPSRREAQFLPVPFEGESGLRKTWDRLNEENGDIV
ncbi:hypothetical protein CTEN210_03308 [Chaetoceros tenuissimus]|uniref:Palmitoyltransferase n=1 Tax=Chaetoceros tenuissimus TaxID=426638 RepID=A0AAD3H1V5_9STRA|nr:hypothetical protein CTEN210_03308 [Chaetoceros tenuissimus]